MTAEIDKAFRPIAEASSLTAFGRKRPSRNPFPEHLPRERVVIAAPVSCSCCGSEKLSKLGEDIAETLEARRKKRRTRNRSYPQPMAPKQHSF